MKNSAIHPPNFLCYQKENLQWITLVKENQLLLAAREIDGISLTLFDKEPEK